MERNELIRKYRKRYPNTVIRTYSQSGAILVANMKTGAIIKECKTEDEFINFANAELAKAIPIPITVKAPKTVKKPEVKKSSYRKLF